MSQLSGEIEDQCGIDTGITQYSSILSLSDVSLSSLCGKSGFCMGNSFYKCKFSCNSLFCKSKNRYQEVLLQIELQFFVKKKYEFYYLL